MEEFGSPPRPDHAPQAYPLAAPNAPASDGTALHVCPACSSDLVYPTEWMESGRTHWSVFLRCPSCEWRGSGLYEQHEVDRFDDELERGTAALTRDLRQLTRANMEDAVDRFAQALHTGHVLPEDF